VIALISIALAAWEAYAITHHRPTVSDLSHTWPYSLGVYGWLATLFVHFIREGKR
jgi:hypothetical protein